MYKNLDMTPPNLPTRGKKYNPSIRPSVWTKSRSRATHMTV
jgi:hypothetical protein